MGSKATKHVLDNVIRPNAKSFISNFGRQMAIPKMPRDADKPIEIPMPDLYKGLGGGADLEPPAIIKLKAISIRHRHGLGKIEKHIFALVRAQPNAAAMASIKIQRDCAR